jgi:hypothetical protein
MSVERRYSRFEEVSVTGKATWKRRDTRQRFEQYARHPGCAANVASAVLGIPMHVVAEKERPGAGTFGQSPFALAHGVTFERALFANGAERLRDGLAKAGVLASNTAGFVDLRLKANGGRMQRLDDAASQTEAILKSLATGERPKLPLIIAGAALQLPGEPVLLPEAMLALDALVLRENDALVELVVGEVKTYADRAGFTNRGELATARAQAGAYAHALSVAVETLRLERRVRVCPSGFLVLARPGSAFPSIRAGEEVRYQAHRAERGFAQLRSAARELQKAFSEPPSEGEAVAVTSAETCYRASCVSFCERAEGCHEAAFRAGDPVVLGEDAKHFLGPVTLYRAAELLDGAKPITPAEKSFVARAATLTEVSR